jgi:predicted NBD/HSP70 family sugar kinase
MQSPGHEEKVIGAVLGSVASSKATSRAGIARATGLARSTIGQYVDRMLSHGLLVEIPDEHSGPGRPARRLQLGQKSGVVAVVELGIDSSQIGVLDLGHRVLARATLETPQGERAETVSAVIASAVGDLVGGVGRGGDLRWLVLSIPSPVDAGRSMAESVSRSGHWWDGFPFVDALERDLGVPTSVENDANLRAVAEARSASQAGPLIYVHLSSGLGAGIVGPDGDLYKGADGMAGDIGHLRVGRDPERMCACGRKGCIGERVTLRSVLADVGLADRPEGSGVNELISLLKSRDRVVLQRVRDYSAITGELIAAVTNFYNPRSVVLGGEMAFLGDEVLSGVRASLYEHSLPIVSRNLSVKLSPLGREGGLIGGGYVAAQGVMRELSRMFARGD